MAGRRTPANGRLGRRPAFNADGTPRQIAAGELQRFLPNIFADEDGGSIRRVLEGGRHAGIISRSMRYSADRVFIRDCRGRTLRHGSISMRGDTNADAREYS